MRTARKKGGRQPASSWALLRAECERANVSFDGTLREVRGAIRLLPRIQLAVEQVRAARVALRYEELEREGHEYPPDYPERLARAIAFVLGRESPKR
jgi:hypothetical protein